ncbi:MAG: hypothetical protein HZC49_01655 [Nitrospirae bacterium]|nr:hypothetical protein [Nitrospirota bacterium]
MKPADEDTTQLRIRRKLKNISDNGLGMKLFFKWGPRTFGVGEKSGWDVYVISVLLGINFISLCLGCIYVAESNQDLFLFMFVVAIIGTIVPVVFIYRGKKHFNITMAYIDEEIDDAAALYNLSIEDFKQSLRELPYG